MDQAVDDRNQVAVVSRESAGSVSRVFPTSSYLQLITEHLASLAHEIRNPLASIKGVADAFLERDHLTRQEREWMETVSREVLKIDARMRELLDLSQPRVFDSKKCSLNELVRGVVVLAANYVNSINSRRGGQISIEFIDATTKPVLLYLDPARLEDAVLNLVLNAIESIDQNGQVTICLARSTRGDGEALIEVTDTGCGIPLENRNRIFEPRFTTKHDGTGLGLPAVWNTAVAYHGRITFKTKIGRGSKFVLALPLRAHEDLTESPA